MKRIIIMLVVLFNISSLAQNSRFEKTFRTSNGNLLTGATIYIVNQSTNDSLQLTEHTTRTGVYFRDNVPWGKYKIYVNGTLVTQDYWHGTDRVQLFVESVDPDGNNLVNLSGLEEWVYVDKSVDIYQDSVTITFSGLGVDVTGRALPTFSTPPIVSIISKSSWGCRVKRVTTTSVTLTIDVWGEGDSCKFDLIITRR